MSFIKVINSWSDDKPLLTGIVDGLEQAINDMNDEKAIFITKREALPTHGWFVKLTL